MLRAVLAFFAFACAAATSHTLRGVSASAALTGGASQAQRQDLERSLSLIAAGGSQARYYPFIQLVQFGFVFACPPRGIGWVSRIDCI